VADITLAIPVHNSTPFLDELFACLRTLDPLPREIIFLDDASSDDSLAHLQGFALPSASGTVVRVLRNERNAGIAGAYNRLAGAAMCEWVQLLDADDLLVEPDYFARVSPALSVDADVVVTALVSNARLLAWGSRLLGRCVPRHPPQWWPLLGSFATRAGVIYRRSRLLETPFPEPPYPGSDMIHLLQLRQSGGCVFLRRPRVFYRVHRAAQSSARRDYATYRHQLARFGPVIHVAYEFDLLLRQLGQWLTR
jgi:glycosyltransferase involved in cell wall biosynthesis